MLIGYFSPGIGREPHLEVLLGAPVARVGALGRGRFSHIAGWGHKPTAARARGYARRHGLPYLALEDGFLRSLGLGTQGARLHSLVVDATGIYYDATGPSDLETLIRDGVAELAADGEARARACMEQLRARRLSKYNHAPDRLPRDLELAEDRARVLVVDQTRGDASIALGLADAGSFERMLSAALEENPGAQVLVKTHPDVVAGKRQGYLLDAARRARCTLIAEDVSPWALLERVDRVYAVTSQTGFEALLAGRPVRCFGMPFYAGWGLTGDDLPPPARRGAARSLEQLFTAAYLRYCRYVNPYTGVRCELEDTVALIGDQKRVQERLRGAWLGVGVANRKRRYIGRFLGAGARVAFAPNTDAIPERPPEGTRVFSWAARLEPGLEARCAQRGYPLFRVEDGFVRSVGLGADLVAPLSLVIDSQGIYYDATRPSDLEVLLNGGDFPTVLLERARRLRERLVALGLSKYNVGEAAVPELPAGRRILLVPGQVETDASIATGAQGVRTNTALLEAARGANPEAFIVYKPHPDVSSGARIGELAPEAGRLFDLEALDVPMPALLERVHEVHTITSLTGFEALLRGRRVVTYGQPFYAGWGLTEDRAEVVRRGRRRSLDELVAATLILYPSYVDPDSGDLINAETAVALLARQRDAGYRLNLMRRVYRLLRRRT